MYPKPIIVEPTKAHCCSVIWLHGLGASADDFYYLLPALSIAEMDSIRWIFPNAPTQAVTINNGMVMSSWFDIFSLAPEFSCNQEDIAKSSDYIYSLLQEEKFRLRAVADAKIYVVGFSQGGVMALHAGLMAVANNLVDQLSILALSCCHPYLQDFILQLSNQQFERVKRGCKVSLMHGDYDEVIPLALGKESYSVLDKFGFSTSWRNYPMGHELSPPQINDISVFFQHN